MVMNFYVDWYIIFQTEKKNNNYNHFARICNMHIRTIGEYNEDIPGIYIDTQLSM